MRHALSSMGSSAFFPSEQHEDEQKAKTCSFFKNNDPVAPSLYQGPHKSCEWCDTVTTKEDTSIGERPANSSVSGRIYIHSGSALFRIRPFPDTTFTGFDFFGYALSWIHKNWHYTCFTRTTQLCRMLGVIIYQRTYRIVQCTIY
jgi:hypothetical protein